jgi:AraC-like DNA-binding protein
MSRVKDLCDEGLRLLGSRSTLGGLIELAFLLTDGSHYCSPPIARDLSGATVGPCLGYLHHLLLGEWIACPLSGQYRQILQYKGPWSLGQDQLLDLLAGRCLPPCAYAPEATAHRVGMALLAEVSNLTARPQGSGIFIHPDLLLACKEAKDANGNITMRAYAHGSAIALASPGTLRTMHSSFGISFREYLRAVRLSVALHRLRDPGEPAKQVAGLLGHREASNFWKEFRRYVGQTPAQYRGEWMRRLAALDVFLGAARAAAAIG